MILSEREASPQRTSGPREKSVEPDHPEKLLKKLMQKLEQEKKTNFSDDDDVSVDDVLEDRDYLIVGLLHPEKAERAQHRK